MKYLITESKMLSVMVSHVEKTIPILLKPLDSKLKHIGLGSNDYSREYDIFKTEYYTQDGELIIEEYSDNDYYHTRERWNVNPELEYLYELFGEETFEKFFLEFHKIDLSSKGNKTFNWFFW